MRGRRAATGECFRLRLSGVGRWGFIGLLTCLLGGGCATDLSVTADAPVTKRLSGDLIERLSGTWQLHTYVASDCMRQHQFPMPAGQSVWTDVGDALSIEATDHVHPQIELFAMNRRMLRKRIYVEDDECTRIESWTLHLVEESPLHLTGRFEVQLQMKGEECEAIRPHVTPEQTCTTTTDWQAHRMSPTAP